jgi:ribosomal protein S18 acetylase RimI-like enzyme
VQNLLIKIIEHNSTAYWSTVALREKVLRAPLGLTFDPKDLSAESKDVHFAVEIDDLIVGCLILKPMTPQQFKMRQVAVDPEHQQKKVGTRLVQFAEEFAVKKNCFEIVLSARESAFQFYLKMGYQFVSDCFIEVGLPHRMMKKIFRR